MARFGVLLVFSFQLGCGRIGYEVRRGADAALADGSQLDAAVVASDARAGSTDAAFDSGGSSMLDATTDARTSDVNAADVSGSDASANPSDVGVTDLRAIEAAVSSDTTTPADVTAGATDRGTPGDSGPACACPFGCDLVGRCRRGGQQDVVVLHGGPDIDNAIAVAVDALGNVWVAGEYWGGSPSFGGAALPPVTGPRPTGYIAGYSSARTHLASRGFASAVGSLNPRVLLPRPGGGVFMSGYYSGTINAGGSTLPTTTGDARLYLAEYDVAGTHIASTGLTTGTARLQDVTDGVLDEAGNIWLTGLFNNGNVNFGGSTLMGASINEDAWVASFTPSFTHRTSFRVGGTGVEHGAGISVSASSIWLGGVSNGSVTIGSTTLPRIGSFGYGFLAEFSNVVTPLARQAIPFGGPSYSTITAVRLDPFGDVWVFGSFDVAIDIGATRLTSRGDRDSYLAKLSPSGAVIFVNQIGGIGEDVVGTDAIFDQSGNVWVSGTFSDTVDFGGGPVTSNGARDTFLLGLTRSGAFRNVIPIGSSTDDFYPMELARGTDDHFWVAGTMRGTTVFASGFLSARGIADMYLLRIDD